MKTTTFETAKVGDKVWSVEYGWGVIRHTTYTQAAPILVVFNITDINNKYRQNGKRLYSENQTLFWDEVEIEAPQKPLPDLEVDTKVLVWNDPSDKHNRHFSHFGAGCVWTFKNGCTSFTSEHISATTAWSYWEVV